MDLLSAFLAGYTLWDRLALFSSAELKQDTINALSMNAPVLGIMCSSVVFSLTQPILKE